MRIGGLTIGPGAWLAPMAGVSDLPFRVLCREQGCPFFITEMVSAKGLLMSPNARAAEHLLATAPGEPIGVQLFGSEPEVMARATEWVLATGRFALVDINMGCPAPKIVGGGDGSALMRDIGLAERVLRAVVGAAGACPVTVKMRLGWDNDSLNYRDFGVMAQDSGASALALHARTRAQFYSGRARWGAIAELKRAVSIPVIANGDIVDAESMLSCMELTGCDEVVVGRAAQGNPWIFAELNAALTGAPFAPPTLEARVAMALRHAESLAEFKGEEVGVREMRKHVAWYLKGFRGSAEARARVNLARTLPEVRELLGDLLCGQDREIEEAEE